jgi:hypothetical protein
MKTFFISVIFILFSSVASANPPNTGRSKFYDFNDQLINGEIRKPTTLYTNARERARFGRLLRLKKSFLPRLFETPKLKLFK